MVRLNVVVSQGQGRNPKKRRLEEELIQQLTLHRGLEVILVPHLYDLKSDSSAMMALKNISGHAVVLSWFFPRAAHWLLARNGVHGQQGTVLLQNDAEEEDQDQEAENENLEKEGTDASFFPQASGPGTKRFLYHVDFRASESPKDFLDEVVRIQSNLSERLVSLSFGSGPSSIQKKDQVESSKEESKPSVANGNGAPVLSLGMGGLVTGEQKNESAEKAEEVSILSDSFLQSVDNPADFEDESPLGSLKKIVDDGTKRRWYPVVDYSRCTNCMECIDFCLFGVYGVDELESLVVEQPDNCRKGCPACSRVCPENAIIFPQHKTPAIAGSNDGSTGLKIDLSKLFGAPDGSVNAEEVAARERDEHLMLNGRQPVGTAVGMKRFRTKEQSKRNELDDLIENLDALDI